MAGSHAGAHRWHRSQRRVKRSETLVGRRVSAVRFGVEIFWRETLQRRLAGGCQVAESPDSIVFGLTEFDMYAVGAPAPYLFDWRQDGRFVVVSSSHMDPGNYLRPVDREVMRSRVQKMITRNVGIMMFGFQLNGDPVSVLSANIATLDDLDRVGTDLPL